MADDLTREHNAREAIRVLADGRIIRYPHKLKISTWPEPPLERMIGSELELVQNFIALMRSLAKSGLLEFEPTLHLLVSESGYESTLDVVPPRRIIEEAGGFN